MPKKKPLFHVLKDYSYVAQLGFSLIFPILILVWLSVWLRDRFGFGDWIVLVAIGLGLYSSFLSAYKFYQYACKQAQKSQDNERE